MKMIKPLLFLTILIGVMSSCKNNYASSNTNASNDKMATSVDSADFTEVQWLDTAKDLGTIQEGQKLEVSFRFKNVGNKPLVIQRVQPSCGCTIAETPKEPIAPGKEGVIKGIFDSNGKVGPNHKTLTVVANTKPVQEHILVFNVVVNHKEGK
jgi:hypothetical protein